jgi:hypothetical protein
VLLIYCANCGGVVGAVEKESAADLVRQLAQRLNATI